MVSGHRLRQGHADSRVGRQTTGLDRVAENAAEDDVRLADRPRAELPAACRLAGQQVREPLGDVLEVDAVQWGGAPLRDDVDVENTTVASPR